MLTGPRRVLAIGIGIVLVIALSMGSAWFAVDRLGGSAGAAGGDSGPSATVEAKARVAIEEITTNLADSGRYIQVSMEVGLADERAIELFEARQGAVRDAILTVLRSRSLEQVAGEEGMRETGRILLGKVSELIGEGRVISLYFTKFLVQ